MKWTGHQIERSVSHYPSSLQLQWMIRPKKR